MTSGPAVQPTDIAQPQSTTLVFHPVVRKLLLISSPAEDAEVTNLLSCRGVHRHSRRRKMRHRNPRETNIRKLRGKV